MGKELELAIKIGGKLDGSLASAVRNAQSQLDSIATGANKAMTAATVAIAGAGIKLVADSVQTYQDYQSALNSAAATAGIERGTAEYEMMNEAAREAGRTTVKTAEESANALEYMALAGWSVEDSTKALMPVLKLSAATGMELGTASDLVTDSMASMGLGIGDLGHYLDTLSVANNTANYNSQQLLESFIGVGGVLKNLNVSFEDGAAVLGVMANQGLKGSEAGTALNAILVNMQKRSGDSYKAMSQLGISMYDTNGNARNLLDVFQDVHDKTASMTQEQKNLMYQMIGGKAHYEDFAKIMSGFSSDTESGIAQAYELSEAYRKCDGALDELYDIKTDTLEGAFETLKSAYGDLQIQLGQEIAPNLQNFAETLAAKMPQIADIIVANIEKIMPLATKALDYLVNNSDKIISNGIKFAETFAMFKIGTGAINGINSVITLASALSKISQSSGAAKVIQGVFGSFAGMGTSAGTLSGWITAGVGSFAAAAAPIALVSGGFIAAYVAAKQLYTYLQNKKLNYADGMSEQAAAVGEAVSSLTKYNDLVTEISSLRMTIQSPDSSTQEVENAKSRLEEIASMLGEEYNLVINADTSELEHAAEMARNLSRSEMLTSSKELITSAQNGAAQYRENASNLPNLQKEQQTLQETSRRYENIISLADTYNNSFKNTGDIEAYRRNIQDLYNMAKESGIEDIDWYGSLNEYNMQDFLKTVNDGANAINDKLNLTNETIQTINKNAKEYEQSTQQAGTYLTEALASDLKNGNIYDADTDVKMIQELGAAMTQAGVSTTDLATKFAAAKEGYTSFSDAIAAGAGNQMAQNFLEYETAIGETAETAVQGAALIQNGFENAAAATAAGDEAINNVITSMKSLGDMQGLFDGLDNNGIADKLTDMAHAMDLIPENKSIAINAEGNFEVIQEAENQIASLNSIGNVDVSVNANGDFSILDEASGEIQTLQGMGAVDLTVNAEGNIDVLDKAGEVIATIDSKSAQVSIDGEVYGMDAIQSAKTAADGLEDKTAVQTVSGVYNGQDVIATAIEYQSQLTDVNKAQTVNGSFNGQGEIATALSYQSQLQDKSVTYTVTYKQNGTPPANNASGDESWRGGLTYVNDQKISDPREVIEYGGNRWYYEGRNVLTDLPRGARIYTASQSRAFINGSHKNGLERVPYDGYIAELHQGERVLTSREASDYGGSSFGEMLDRFYAVLDEYDGGGNNGGGQDDDGGGGGQIIFSPQITVNGNGDKDTIMTTMRMTYREFREFMEEYERDNRRKVF